MGSLATPPTAAAATAIPLALVVEVIIIIRRRRGRVNLGQRSGRGGARRVRAHQRGYLDLIPALVRHVANLATLAARSTRGCAALRVEFGHLGQLHHLLELVVRVVTARTASRRASAATGASRTTTLAALGVRIVTHDILPDAVRVERRRRVHAVVVRHAHTARGGRHLGKWGECDFNHTDRSPKPGRGDPTLPCAPVRGATGAAAPHEERGKNGPRQRAWPDSNQWKMRRNCYIRNKNKLWRYEYHDNGCGGSPPRGQLVPQQQRVAIRLAMLVRHSGNLRINIYV